MKMERLKVWVDIYIMIVVVGKEYRQASGKVGLLSFVIFLWIEVVSAIAFFLFLSAL